MFSINFYNFAKKENSTARPSGDGTSYSCNINSATGIISPTISLGLPVTEAPTFTYCFIPAWHRYYYVNEWRYVIGTWEADLRCDVLATYRSQIGSSSLYVLRSSAAWNGDIVDTLYPIKTTYTKESAGTGNWLDSSNGWYVVGVVGRVSGQIDPVGGVTYMVLDPAAFKEFREALFKDDLSWYKADDPDKDNGLDALGESLTKMIFDPFQYVRSCVWVPDKPVCLKDQPLIGNDIIATSWYIGFWIFTTTNGIRFLDPNYLAAGYAEITIPKHPKAETRGEYLNTAPYSTYNLQIPGIGIIPLDSSKLVKSSKIRIWHYFDAMSGTSWITIETAGEPQGLQRVVLDYIPANLVVPVQLAQSGTGRISALQNIAGVAYDAAVGSIGALGGAISSVLSMFQPQIQTIGQDGGIAANTSTFPLLQGVFYDVVDDDIDHHGRPLCEERVLSTIPGYIQCMDGDLAIDATEAEKNEIRAYLEGGFYYE